MYHNFYGLSQNPFNTTSDPEFLYLSPSHKEALASIIYGVQERKGFVAVTGEVGLGKTTILRSYLSNVDKADNIIYLLNPRLSFHELLKTLLIELKQDPRGSVELALVSQIQEVLIEEYRRGKRVVLLIDEAQNMPIATLEGMRMLSNLETAKDKLIQIVLVGQPELDEVLNRHELRQLRQRIAVRASIAPLSRTESCAYIRHRLAKAGSRRTKVFSNRALSLIARNGEGNPRRINILCDNALVTGLGYRKKPVTAAIVREVVDDLNGTTRRPFWKWGSIAASMAIALLAGVWLTSSDSHTLWNTVYMTKVKHLIEEEINMRSLQTGVQQLQAKLIQVVTMSPQKEQGARSEVVYSVEGSLAVSTVQEGDSLESLAEKVYGTAKPEYMKQILDANPQIGESKRIYPGQRVVFPKIVLPAE
jgi:general secretion pathway protein A